MGLLKNLKSKHGELKYKGKQTEKTEYPVVKMITAITMPLFIKHFVKIGQVF
jgi:hypothetical protein